MIYDTFRLVVSRVAASLISPTVNDASVPSIKDRVTMADATRMKIRRTNELIWTGFCIMLLTLSLVFAAFIFEVL